MIRAVWPIASIKLKGPPCDMGHGTVDKGLLVFQMPRTLEWFVMAYQLAPAKYKRWKTHMQDVLTAEHVVDIVIVTDCHGEPCAAHTFPTSSTCGQCQQGTIHHLDPQNSRSSPGSWTWQQTVIFNKWVSLKICCSQSEGLIVSGWSLFSASTSELGAKMG